MVIYAFLLGFFSPYNQKHVNLKCHIYDNVEFKMSRLEVWGLICPKYKTIGFFKYFLQYIIRTFNVFGSYIMKVIF